jgi:uncharacterized small protein (DUF1192 family)
MPNVYIKNKEGEPLIKEEKLDMFHVEHLANRIQINKAEIKIIQ